MRVVAVLGQGLVPAHTPVLRADDLGVVRGDGVFETIHVRRGRPWLLDAHLDRLARSAARLDLALPDRADLADLAGVACGAWPPEVEGALRLVCTRGPEEYAGAGPVTVFATLAPVPATAVAARRDGIAVATAGLGVPAAVRPSHPYLLSGVKSVSYAMNMASLRWAYAQGLDDMLWVSTDGYALEGPTSTLVWLAGGTLWTVPAEPTGVLPGITAGWLLDHAADLGFQAGQRLVRPDELPATDGVWLVSSVRGPVPVRVLDGAVLPLSPHVPAIRTLLGHPAPVP